MAHKEIKTRKVVKSFNDNILIMINEILEIGNFDEIESFEDYTRATKINVNNILNSMSVEEVDIVIAKSHTLFDLIDSIGLKLDKQAFFFVRAMIGRIN